MTNYSVVTLNQCLEKLESGGRPKGGASLDKNGILSIGAEHLGDDGEIKLENPKFIPLTYFENMRQGIVQDEDILIVKDGATTGKVVYISSNSLPNKTAVNEHVFLLRTNKKLLLPKFAFYLMYSPTGKQKILADFRGAAQGGISRSFVNNFTFPLPPLSEQRRIVEILDQADEIRKLRKQADEKAEKIIPALFYKMFGDPISNSKNFPTKPILKLGNVVTGLTPPSKFEGMWGGEIPFITPGDLENKNGTVQRFVTTKGAKNSKVVRKGSTLVCCIGASIGKVDKARVLSAFNQQINAVEWDLKHIYDNYGLYVMRFLRPILISKGTSTTLPILKKSVFEQIFIPVPPLADQIKFSKFVDQFEQTLTNCYSSNDKIQILFNVILAKAFDGSLTASWREAHMKELLKEMEEQKKYLEQVK